MSLTDHLRTPTSPVRIFLEDSFPILEGTKRGSPLAKELSRFLGFDKLPPCRLPTLAPKYNQGTIGTAVDYRLRCYFQTYRPFDTTAAGVNRLGGKAGRVGSRFLDYHDGLVTGLDPSAHHLSADDEAALNTSCVVMAWFEQIYRSGSTAFPELDALPKNVTVEDLLAIVPSEVVQDIEQLSAAFASDAKHLFKPDPILNPTFSGSLDVGGADADIIVDRILIDFKCTSKVDALKLRAAALQLLAYVLLDYDRRYAISEIMVYLPRQRSSWRIPLWHFVLPPADVILAMSRGETSDMDSLMEERLKKLRQEFRRVIRQIE